VCEIWYSNTLRNMGCGNSEPYLTSVTCNTVTDVQHQLYNPYANHPDVDSDLVDFWSERTKDDFDNA